MFVFRPLLFAALPFFAGCQMLDIFSAPAPVSDLRIQGEISQNNGQLILKRCADKTTYLLLTEQNPVFTDQIKTLLADSGAPLFADLRGTLEKGSSVKSLDQLAVTKLFRLQGEGPGCGDPNFKKLLIRAHGNEPGWNININSKGLVLERMGQVALALPYLEEQLPDGGSSISSEADGLKLEIWLSPQSCTDTMTGSVEHLTAVLNLNGETLRGCGSYGAMRNL